MLVVTESKVDLRGIVGVSEDASATIDDDCDVPSGLEAERFDFRVEVRPLPPACPGCFGVALAGAESFLLPC